MSDNLFKKALGVFVNFDEEKQEQTHVEAEAPDTAATHEAAQVAVEPGADITQDADVVRVRQAIQLLADLPLEDIPVDKARKLIAGALKLAGLEAEDLAGSFERARSLHREQIAAEQQQMANRQQVNQERLTLLEKAITEEKAQCAAELQERGRRIEQASADLGQIEKAMAFFAPGHDEGAGA
jgi:hypothetical protein